ncbi:unnamed protein product [Tuwongella immobilis]|uniref:Uncharacterized protein n=1 Tax=Tuwongella immobilis TaxID=692036 RepID=A0A6C2YV24_9BACT|nr:unnamed protein product [Tuwongella immobilis]VTS08531.1 unnamed protein product [Tuwongella immobilis]
MKQLPRIYVSDPSQLRQHLIRRDLSAACLLVLQLSNARRNFRFSQEFLANAASSAVGIPSTSSRRRSIQIDNVFLTKTFLLRGQHTWPPDPFHSWIVPGELMCVVGRRTKGKI